MHFQIESYQTKFFFFFLRNASLGIGVAWTTALKNTVLDNRSSF